MTRIATTISNALLGSERRQRLRASQSLLVLTVYVVFALVQHGEVRLGMIEASQSWPLTAWGLSGGVFFFVMIRSGLNLRLPASMDPSLPIPQSLWAMVAISWSYGITGQARGGVILIMMLVVTFTIFSLNARQARLLAAIGFAMIVSVMAYKAHVDPTRYEPRVEIVHAMFAAIVMVAMVALAVRVGRMRAGLQRQRAELAQALERIQMLATRDELTGLTNRRAAMERMHAELAVRHRPEPGMALALIDLDHFKSINDTLGHATGDAVLRRFAECATSVVRAGDFLARWGGEEFLLVMPATTPEEGLAVLARLRERLLHETSDADTSAPKVTFSAGVTRCVDLQDLGQAIARADEAMYCAKRSGRDRALLVPAPALTPAPEIRQPA